MLRFGTCSWKYDSWKGIIYSDKARLNYLKEYADHYNTVEVDQWFWSLFEGSPLTMPESHVVENYNESTPDQILIFLILSYIMSSLESFRCKFPENSFGSISSSLINPFLNVIPLILKRRKWF